MMMKMRLICLGFLLNCLVYYTNGQTFVCNSIDGYDIKPLARALEWQVTTDYQCLGDPAADCTYYFSFCQPASMCFNHYSACQNATGASNVTVIGDFTTKQFHANDTSIKGFYAQFPPGPVQNISNTTQCRPSLRINFICNLDATWLSPADPNETLTAPQPTDVNIDPNDPCATIMVFDYAGACLKGEAPTTGISAGALFLIILFSFALVYFIAGAIYNGLVKHRSGINLLPHAQFWIGLPLYAIEGCRASLNCCSGTPKPSQATYESV